MRTSKIMAFLVVTVSVVLMTGVTAQGQTTWYVDDDAPNDPGPGTPQVSDPLEDGSAEHPFDSIQEGINAAVNGDTVLVAGGTYDDDIGDLDFAGRLITVRSQNGPETCIIDCEHQGRGFHFHSGETAEAVLDGFTITNGDSDSGGGIYNDGSSPTVINCIFMNNSAATGGGMYNSDSSPTLINCTFSDNSANDNGGGMYNNVSSPTVIACTFSRNSGGYGGGMYNYYSHPTIANCTFEQNRVSTRGAGVFNQDSAPWFIECLFTQNDSDVRGGGISNDKSPITLLNCTFTENSAALGGGIYSYLSDFAAVNCTFANNSAANGGGMFNFTSDSTIRNCVFEYNLASTSNGSGMHNFRSSPSVTNCIFDSNSALSAYGGGMCNRESPTTITNCVFYNNFAGYGGGGVYNKDCSPTVTNSILWSDTPDEILNHPSAPIVMYCDVQGGWPGVGNIDCDPLFVQPRYWDKGSTLGGPKDDSRVDGDYHLQSGSPRINAGNPAYNPSGATDLDGHTRVLCNRVDMGAYEFGIGDYDCDRVVDLTDFAYWALCMTGPDAGPYGAGCEAFDFELDTDVDVADFAGFQRVFGGP